MDCRLTCIKRGGSRNGSCLFLCPLMNKSTLEQANQAVATINLKGSKFISHYEILYFYLPAPFDNT